MAKTTKTTKTESKNNQKQIEDIIPIPIAPPEPAPAPAPVPESVEKRGRKKKYSTEEEAHTARLEQMRLWRERRKQRALTITTPNEDTKGELINVLVKCLQTTKMSAPLEASILACLEEEQAQE